MQKRITRSSQRLVKKNLNIFIKKKKKKKQS